MYSIRGAPPRRNSPAFRAASGQPTQRRVVGDRPPRWVSSVPARSQYGIAWKTRTPPRRRYVSLGPPFPVAIDSQHVERAFALRGVSAVTNRTPPPPFPDENGGSFRSIN